MTLAEKILASHTGKTEVHAGEFVSVSVDLALTSDSMRPAIVQAFKQLDVDRPFSPSRAVLVTSERRARRQLPCTSNDPLVERRAAVETVQFGIQETEAESITIKELGASLPGAVVVGSEPGVCSLGALGAFAALIGATDIPVTMATGQTWMRVPTTIKLVFHGDISRWVSGVDLALFTIGDMGADGALYSAIEIAGPTIDRLTIDDRFALAAITTEVGAKASIMRVDNSTLAYLCSDGPIPRVNEESADVDCGQVIEYNVARITPQVAILGGPPLIMPVEDLGRVGIERVLIGGNGGAGIRDLRVAAHLLGGRHVHPNTSCTIIPRSPSVYLEALTEGLVDILGQAGAGLELPESPSRGECDTGVQPVGISATSEQLCVSRLDAGAATRYLAGTAIAAASAVVGALVSPLELDE